MEPRLSTSKKWTPVPEDYKNQVLNVLKTSFVDETKRGEWVFEGRIYAEELLLRVGFLENGRLKQLNFEISIQFKAGKDNVHDLLGLAVDVGASLLEDAFKSEDDADFPKIWQEFVVERRPIYIQYSAVNTKLEEEADRLLGLNQDGLVRQSTDEDAAELIKSLKEKLGLNPDEDLPTEEDEETENEADASNPKNRVH